MTSAPKQEPEPACGNPYREALEKYACGDPDCTFVDNAMWNEWCPHASDYRHCAVVGCHGAIYLGGPYCYCGDCNACICARHYECDFRCARCERREEEKDGRENDSSE